MSAVVFTNIVYFEKKTDFSKQNQARIWPRHVTY